MFADFIDKQENHVLHALWLSTDSAAGRTFNYWVEVGRIVYWDDRNDAYTHFDGFYWARQAKVNGVIQYKDWDLNTPLTEPVGTMYHYRITWNRNSDGYDVWIMINGTNYLVGTAHYNNLNAYHAELGSESNHCDGDDGDSFYNWIEPTYTNRWNWKDDDGQWHAIINPGLYNNPPADIWLYSNLDSACFNMNNNSSC